MARITQVRTRDGRVVAFDGRRVTDAIHRGLCATGSDDRFLAEELAGVVRLYLERAGLRVPSVAEIARTVERVLDDTGHAPVARAYAARRERRGAARDGLAVELDDPDAADLAGREPERGATMRPLVGGESGGPVRAWSRDRIVAALRAEAGLDAETALDVARAVEDRVLARGASRIGSSLVRALVDAELFQRGHVATRDRQRVVGLPKRDLAERLAAGAADRRVGDPAALAEAVGEEVLRQHVLEDELPPDAAEAHRLGDVHASDLGAPLAARHVSLSMEALLARHLRGDPVPRVHGPRRAAAALAEAVLHHASVAARTFALEDVNVHLAPFFDRLDEDALHLEARELLLSPAFQAFPRRGGLLRLELVLAASVPERLASREAEPPAPPGRVLGEYDDAALRLAKAILLAAGDLWREGARLPELTFVLPRGGELDPATRALVQAALLLAAEVGEPAFVFDAPGLPARGGRSLRATGDDGADPLRHARGDVTVGSLVSIDVAAAALRSAHAGVDAFLDDLDRLASLAVAVAAARRGLLARGGASPDGSLWAMRRGMEPLLDPDAAVHVVEPVGLARALEVMAEVEGRADLAARVAHRLRARVADEARRHDLSAVVADVGDPEAAARFAAIDRERFVVARGWFRHDETPTYLAPTLAPTLSPTHGPNLASGADPADDPRASSRAADATRYLEPAVGVTPRGARPRRRVRMRLEGERRPGVDVLLRALLASAQDPEVAEFVLDPWPRRIVRT